MTVTPDSAKPFLRALKGETVGPPPIWMMRQAGRYLPEYREIRQTATNFLEFCYTPDLAVEVTLQPLRRYGFDAAILFCDILVVPDALGQHVAFVQGEGPVLEPLRTREDVAALKRDGAVEHLSPVMETVSRLSREIPDETALIGFCGAPWTVAVYMVEGRGGTDHGTILDWSYRDPKGFGKLIDVVTETSADYLLAQIESGAEAVQIFDTWSGVLTETGFERWVIEPTRRIVDRIRAEHPGFPIIGFPRAAGPKIPRYVEATGVSAVSLDQTVPLDWARNAVQPLCAVQGNLDNRLLVIGGAEMDAEIDRILENLAGGPFIFNLGHGVVPQTPPENVARVVERVRAWKG